MIRLRFALMVVVLVSTACGKKDALQGLDEAQLASPPEYVTIKIKGYRPQPGAGFQHLFVSNFSVKVSRGRLLPSTARDGMDDATKVQLAPAYGFRIDSPESVVTGFSDALLFNIGVTLPQQSLVRCSGGQMLSSSNDALIYNDSRLSGSPTTFLGLRDCEKVYLGLNPSKFDNAGNGIPDYMKLRCGLNPTAENEAYVSSAGDGVANIDKCKRNIPIDESASTQPNQLFAYKYKTEYNVDGTSDFTISNIPVLNSGEQNFIAFYVTETGLSSKAPALFTAFAVLKAGYAGRTLEIDYWATSAATFSNQEILVP